MGDLDLLLSQSNIWLAKTQASHSSPKKIILFKSLKTFHFTFINNSIDCWKRPLYFANSINLFCSSSWPELGVQVEFSRHLNQVSRVKYFWHFYFLKHVFVCSHTWNMTTAFCSRASWSCCAALAALTITLDSLWTPGMQPAFRDFNCLCNNFPLFQPPRIFFSFFVFPVMSLSPHAAVTQQTVALGN